MEQRPDAPGKKIFLLYPHSVIRDEMLDMLIMAGYETYTLVDEKKAKKLLAKCPGSIMFINIDEGLKENEWEKYIKDIMEDPLTQDSRLGIMSYNQDRDLMQKYLMELSIPCGYVQLKLGLNESTRIILGALEANEARGRRKCIRADCHDDINASINFKGDSGVYHGKILDISAAGIAAKYDKFASLPTNSVLKDVQLRLRGGLVMTDMIFMGQRHGDRQVQIQLFDPKMSTNNKLVIHRYIKQCLQKYIDGLKI
jgi:L-rhamnose mutarotase